MPNSNISLYEALNLDRQYATKVRGVTVPVLTQAMGHKKTSSWLYDLCNKGLGDWVWEHVEPWIELTGGRHLMQWLARRSNHVAYPIEDLPTRGAISNVVKEFGEFLESDALANPDGINDVDELKELERETLEAMGALWAHVERRRTEFESYQSRRTTPAHAEKF